MICLTSDVQPEKPAALVVLSSRMRLGLGRVGVAVGLLVFWKGGATLRSIKNKHSNAEWGVFYASGFFVPPGVAPGVWLAV